MIRHYSLVFYLGLLCSFSIVTLPAQFTDVSALAGINVTHDGDASAEPPPHPSMMGHGAAWIDYNNDGWLDLYITMRQGANYFFRNNGDGTFTDVAASLGVADPGGNGAGVVAADFNNDGWTDIYLANAEEDYLFKNVNGTQFIDITISAGLTTGLEGRGTSASWGDYDQDGHLDLYVGHHLPMGFVDPNLIQDRIYRNNGDETFTDVSYLFPTVPLKAATFIAAWTDIDNDCDLDLIQITDCPVGGVEEPLSIFRNNGGTDPLMWNFEEVSNQLGVNDCKNGMGIAVGDLDHNGYMDFYFSNIGPATLYKNYNGTFVDATTPVIGEQERYMWSWGTCFFDYDKDGWQDILLAMDNPGEGNPHPSYNQMFRNEGDGATFTDVSEAMNMNDSAKTHSVIYGDYDNDGDLDIFVAGYNDKCFLKRNDTDNNNNWIKIELVGTQSNRQGIGARIKIKTPDGDTQYFETRAGSNLGGGDALYAYFGLGSNRRIDEVEVQWPSSCGTQTITGVGVNQTLTITEQMDIPTCDDGIQNGDETDIDCGGSSCPPCDVACSDTPVSLSITLDRRGTETTWTLIDGNNGVIASGGPYFGTAQGTVIEEDFCLTDDCYTFTIFDSRNNGICCSNGNGSYALVNEATGEVLASGGAFGSQDATEFCIGSSPAPSCDDGIQNGDETGVDCGGSICPPCVTPPTCDDGIQNGDETGVDCGGSVCPPCVTPPTCDDGIQNGDETGVDCGGSVCPPCVTPPTCDDGIQNGDETGIDCGGSVCPPCGSCTGNSVTLSLILDSNGHEVTWDLLDDNDNVLHSGGPYIGYSNGDEITEDFCLSDGCFTFNIYDAGNNGLCCRRGIGSYTLINNANGAILGSGSYFRSSATVEFCFGPSNQNMQENTGNAQVLSVPTIVEGLTTFPNPVKNNELWINYNGQSEQFHITIHDSMGRVVKMIPQYYASDFNTSLRLESLGMQNKGLYFMTFTSESEKYVQKVLVQ